MTRTCRTGHAALEKGFSMKHPSNRKQTFHWLVEKARTFDRQSQGELINQHEVGELDRYVTSYL